MKSKTKEFYYAVWKGFTVGIFNNWNEAQQSINGYSGSAHCKFSDYGDAVRKVEKELAIQGLKLPYSYIKCNDAELW